MFIPIILIVSFVIFLFCFYVLANDDFVLLRKNFTIEQGFNLAFLLALVGLFSARLVHVIFHFDTIYINPLVFLAFTHVPGLSLTGGILGAIIFFFIYTRSKKIPTFRLFDFYLLSLFLVIPICYLLFSFFNAQIDVSFTVILPLVYLLGFFFFIKVLVKKYREGELKDGTLGMLFIMFYAAITITYHLSLPAPKQFLFFGKEDLLLLGLFFLSLSGVFKQEQFLQKMVKKNKR